MIVRTDMKGDARVDREASSLAQNGYKVVVVNTGNSKGKEDAPKPKPYFLVRALGKGKPNRLLFLVLFNYLVFIVHSFFIALSTKAHIYHAHDLDTVIPAYLASRLRKAKFIFDAHELWNKNEKNFFKRLQRNMELYFAKRADAVISVNVERAKIIKHELQLIKMPIVLRNVPFIRYIEKTDLLPVFLSEKGVKGKKIVLYQGIIRPGRAYEKLINVAKDLSDNAVMIFLGNPCSEIYLRSLKDLRDKVAKNKVFFHPFVLKEKLLSFTASAHVGLVLYENVNRNSYYCAPNKVYEYMLCGIPVVASNFPPLFIVEQEHFGFCADPAKPEAIISKVNQLILDIKLYAQFSKSAKILVNKKYNWDLESGKLIGLYEKI